MIPIIPVLPQIAEVDTIAQVRNDLCVYRLNESSRITRQNYAWVLKLPKGTPKQQVEQRLGSPYCQLPSWEEGKRFAYPIDRDPETWVVLFYKNGRLIGSSFNYLQERMGGR